MLIGYHRTYKDQILAGAGLARNKNNYIVDKKTGKPIKDISGEFVKYDQFAGYRKGSREVFKTDVTSLIALAKKARQDGVLEENS